MTHSFNPKRLQLPARPTVSTKPQGTTTKRRRRTAWFLKGPISWAWLSAAARLPGRALHVALWIRFWSGVKRSNQVAISISGLSVMGVSRYAAYRGLAALEGAGLVAVRRHRGRKPRVTVIEMNADDEIPTRA